MNLTNMYFLVINILRGLLTGGDSGIFMEKTLQYKGKREVYGFKPGTIKRCLLEHSPRRQEYVVDGVFVYLDAESFYSDWSIIR